MEGTMVVENAGVLLQATVWPKTLRSYRSHCSRRNNGWITSE